MGPRYIPEKFKCATASQVEEALGRAALKRIRQLGLTAAELKQTHPSIRLGHLRKLENDERLGYRIRRGVRNIGRNGIL